MNEKGTHREAFRPVAPACRAGRSGAFFGSGGAAPVMLLVVDVLVTRTVPADFLRRH